MSWRGAGGGVVAAQRGHQVIMCPNTRCYFDYRQAPNDKVCALAENAVLQRTSHAE